jgi:hypothetical protein
MQDIRVIFGAFIQEEVLLIAIDLWERAFWKLIATSSSPEIQSIILRTV